MPPCATLQQRSRSVGLQLGGFQGSNLSPPQLYSRDPGSVGLQLGGFQGSNLSPPQLYSRDPGSVGLQLGGFQGSNLSPPQLYSRDPGSVGLLQLGGFQGSNLSPPQLYSRDPGSVGLQLGGFQGSNLSPPQLYSRDPGSVGLQLGGFQGSNLSPPQLYSRDPGSGYRWLEVPQNLSAQPQVDEMGRPRVLHAGSHPHISWAAPRQEGNAEQGSPSLVPKISFQENNITYQLCLDMHGFLAEELTVKMDGRKLTVSGKHKKKTRSQDDCAFHDCREVLREVLLPEDANLDAVTCTLSHDGKLCFQVPRQAATAPKVTDIPVTKVPQGQRAGGCCARG
ncbi:polycystic kidney disease protein 1-like 3 [Lacerta agilis]|uniref:polycystic kidney disease protein 1-like 3 n=1 Tax=Lacerta agilis TaxID=80427 RepID=UPI00141A46D4|nr:polycystic kidney disease protein 1-like 3 [Lacerta agilis]